MQLQTMRWTLAVLPAALLIGGCAIRVDGSHGGPGGDHMRSSMGSTRALPLQVCDTTKTTCGVAVQVRPDAPAENPATGTWDCGVAVTELLLVRRGVDKLQWTLPPNLSERNAYRFKKPQRSGSLPGIYAYAKDAQREFAPKWVSETVYEFAVLARSSKGFAYGIYLEWKPAGTAEWLTCTPLDPIIVNMD